MKILVLHGPNLHLLGKISASSGSRQTLDKVNKALRRFSRDNSIELIVHHLFDEKSILKTLNSHRNDIDGILIAPCSLALNCFLLREMLTILKIPVIEIIPEEFPFSQDVWDHSLLQILATDRYTGKVPDVYLMGLQKFITT